MEEAPVLNRLTVLGHAGRMSVFRLLMRRLPDEVPAGEIGQALDIKPSTLSVHLSALAQAGLVSQHRAGTSIRYRAETGAAGEIVDFLYNDCCRGRPALCLPAPTPKGGPDMANDKYHVLFICSGNSARSIFAEEILRKLANGRFEAYSAGTQPSSELNPFALDVLKSNGHDISGLRAKNVREFQGAGAPKFDFVFTVCNSAANEECPAWAGQPISAHWGMPDPVKAEGTETEKNLAFHQAYGALYNRISLFASLPLDSLDQISLQKAVDDLGRAGAGEPA